MRARFAAGLAWLALLSGQAWAAQAQPAEGPPCPPSPNWSSERPMRFTVAQVDGAPVLLAEGVIDEAMLPRLQQALDGFRGREIHLRPPGGDARAGNLAGRLIRDHYLATRIPAGWACASACAFMFMGGIMRSVDEGGVLMVRMFTHADEALAQELARAGAGTDRLLTAIARDSALMASEDNDYLLRMGVSRRFLTEIVYRQPAFDPMGRPAPPRCLSPAEMRQYNVVNGGPPPAPPKP